MSELVSLVWLIKCLGANAYVQTVQDGSQCSDIGLDADVRGPDVLPLHLDACHVVARLCKEFTDLTKREQLTDDLRQCLDGVVDSLKNAIDPKPQTVAVVGQTGSGKSVLLCALIKASLLPSSSVVCINCTSGAHVVKLVLLSRGMTRIFVLVYNTDIGIVTQCLHVCNNGTVLS